jgi:hypothetical protein
MVEIVQDHGSLGMPVDDRRDLGRDVIGLSAGDPLLEKRIVCHLAARAADLPPMPNPIGSAAATASPSRRSLSKDRRVDAVP